MDSRETVYSQLQEYLNLVHKEGQNIGIGPQERTEHWSWFTRKDRNLRVTHREGQRTFGTDPQNIESTRRRTDI